MERGRSQEGTEGKREEEEKRGEDERGGEEGSLCVLCTYGYLHAQLILFH